MLELEQILPAQPEHGEAEIERLRKGGDAVPILYDWASYVTQLCSIVSCIEPCSSGIKALPELHRTILSGLLNRCAHLAVSLLKLASEGKHGETIGVLARCIAEAATNVMWLCRKDESEAFNRYLADGLQTDLKLKDEILSNISARGDEVLVIEKRMLGSVGRCVASSGLTEEQIRACARLPGLHDQLVAVGLVGLYTAGFRMGAHWVHGTWTDLRRHYVAEDEPGRYRMRCMETRVHSNQLLITSLFIIHALLAFVDYLCLKDDDREFFHGILGGAKDRIMEIETIAMGNDFEVDEANE